MQKWGFIHCSGSHFFSFNWLFNYFFHTMRLSPHSIWRLLRCDTPLYAGGEKLFLYVCQNHTFKFPKMCKTLLSPVACTGIRSIYLSRVRRGWKTHLEQNFENYISSPSFFFRLPRRFSTTGYAHPRTPTCKSTGTSALEEVTNEMHRGALSEMLIRRGAHQTRRHIYARLNEWRWD